MFQRSSNKYHVSSTYERTLDGIVFDSKAEMTMYAELKLLEKQKLIKDLQLQPKFELQPAYTNAAGKKIRAISYSADFSFYSVFHKKQRVIDCKGFKTQQFVLRQKMFDFIMKDQGIYLEDSI